jgi:ribosomal protein S18 acetylase RimI-like enzyme
VSFMGRDVRAADPHPVLRLRKATQADAAMFPGLEQSAGLLFKADPEIAWLAEADNLPAERYRDIIAEGWSWIADGERAQPVGFAAATREGEELHLWEFNVHIGYQRRGIGRGLLRGLIAEATAAKVPSVTLTTFRDVPWNAPFYRSMGFELVAAGQLDPRLAGLLAKEVRMGLPAARRCAMRRRLLA